jgi:hypothetical protein
MPLLQEELLILRDDLADFAQFVAAETAVVRECNRLQPEFRITAGVSNVDVRWLSSLETVKKESVTTNPQKRRHRTSLPLSCATENFPLQGGKLQAPRLQFERCLRSCDPEAATINSSWELTVGSSSKKKPTVTRALTVMATRFAFHGSVLQSAV